MQDDDQEVVHRSRSLSSRKRRKIKNENSPVKLIITGIDSKRDGETSSQPQLSRREEIKKKKLMESQLSASRRPWRVVNQKKAKYLNEEEMLCNFQLISGSHLRHHSVHNTDLKRSSLNLKQSDRTQTRNIIPLEFKEADTFVHRSQQIFNSGVASPEIALSNVKKSTFRENLKTMKEQF